MCQVDSEKEDLLFLVKLQEQAELSRMSSAPNRSPVLLHVRKITKFRNPWSPSSFLTSLPFGFTFLTPSGEENIKAPQTLKSLYLLLRVLNWLFFLCRYEKDMVLPLVIFALWERSRNNIPDTNRLQMTAALWKSLLQHWFTLGMKASLGWTQTQGCGIPGTGRSCWETGASRGISNMPSSEACFHLVPACESLPIYSTHTLCHFQVMLGRKS